MVGGGWTARGREHQPTRLVRLCLLEVKQKERERKGKWRREEGQRKRGQKKEGRGERQRDREEGRKEAGEREMKSREWSGKQPLERIGAVVHADRDLDVCEYMKAHYLTVRTQSLLDSEPFQKGSLVKAKI